MSPAPETIAVQPRAMTLFGYGCGALGMLLGVFIYSLFVAQRPAPTCAVPQPAPSASRALVEAQR